MSWLSPKRRRTTGNLKTLNGTATATAHDDGSAGNRSNPGSPQTERPRPVSQPMTMNAFVTPSEGNLFYAYARRADDLTSRYLLTFASAAIASEWWRLVQVNFPDSSRPGPQLFSFKQDDLLSRAWKHTAFEHLKSKWMYIQFGDAGNVGGAAQGIIPVQDASGNMLGGSTSPTTQSELGQVKKESKKFRNELSVLEEHFEQMMAAVERNTETIAALAEKRDDRRSGSFEPDGVNGKETNGDSYFNLPGMSTHLGQISDQLLQNLDNARDLARKQEEHEKRVISMVEENVTRQQNDRLDLSSLSSHLDRIQGLMEREFKARKDLASEATTKQASQRVDFAPLVERLEKVQEAIEQNSDLVKTMLEQRAEDSVSADRVDTKAAALDLSPLAEQLERIHNAIEQQSSHMQALTGLAHENEEDNDDTAPQSPSGGHLGQIQSTIEEGNDLVKKQKFVLSKRLDDLLKVHKESSKQKPDLSPLTGHLEAIRHATEQNTESIAQLVEAHRSVGERTSPIDFTPLTERLNNIHASLERQSEKAPGSGDGKFLISALASHLSKIQAVTEHNAQHIRVMREKQAASQEKMQIAVAETAEQIRTVAKRNDEIGHRERTREVQMREFLSGQREMVEVMRELANSLKNSNGRACEHIIVPPPRKMGRKIVGFVYDAKDGPV